MKEITFLRAIVAGTVGGQFHVLPLEKIKAVLGEKSLQRKKGPDKYSLPQDVDGQNESLAKTCLIVPNSARE